MHFLIAGTLVWNVMETTQKNEVIVYLLCSLNYEIKIVEYLRFSFDSRICIETLVSACGAFRLVASVAPEGCFVPFALQFSP
jgi:flavoprotein